MLRARTSLLLVVSLAILGCGRPEERRTPERNEKSEAPRGKQFALSNLIDLGHRDVRGFAFEPGTRQLFVSFDDRSNADVDAEGDRLYQWDVDAKTLIHTYSIEPGWLVDDIFTSEGASRVVLRLYRPRNALGSPSTKYALMDPVKHAVVATDLGLHDDRNADVIFGRDGKRFLLSSAGTFDGLPKRLVFDEGARPVPEIPSDFSSPEKPYEKPRLSVIESSKTTVQTHGLYYTDDAGARTLVTQQHWHDNFALTRDGRYLVTTTWDGELLVWSTAEKREVHREKLAAQYGHLAYDAKGDRFLLGDATHNGTTFLRQFQVIR